jgi:hypothetical protein
MPPLPDASPHIWFGFWMGTADGHRDKAAYYRALGQGGTLDRADAEIALSAAYHHDKLQDAALMQAIAWGSKP